MSGPEQPADVVIFPELSITGYPPGDLLLKPSFVRDAAAAFAGLTPELRPSHGNNLFVFALP